MKKLFLSIFILYCFSCIYAEKNLVDHGLLITGLNDRITPGRSFLNAYFFNVNYPGGIPDYTADLNFDRSSLVQFNQFGSFGSTDNGITMAIKSGKYRFLTRYSYLNNNGYRQHNSEYWQILNVALETNPGPRSELTILGYYINGQINFPGSLTKAEFEIDPYNADPRSVNRDEKKKGTMGRVDIMYKAKFGKSLNSEITVAGYGNIQSYIRSTREYKIVNKYCVGLSGMYVNSARLGSIDNIFSIGGDLFTQPERTEEYENFGGEKSDQLEQLKSEKTERTELFITDNIEIVKKKLFVNFTGKYENLTYKLTEETLPARSDKKIYQGFSPELTVKYQVRPWIAVNASYGLSFDPPDDNQLDSPYPAFLYNQDLLPQKSKTFQLGIESNIIRADTALFFKKLYFRAGFFKSDIENELVPYEVYGDMFFRNASRSDRLGFELESRLEIYKNLDFEFSCTGTQLIYKSYATQSLEADSTGNLVDVNRDFAGNRGPNDPACSMFVGLSYKYPVVKKIDIFARLSYQVISGFWADDANTGKTGAHRLLDGLLGIEMKFGKFNILASAGLNNIFNEIYVGYATVNSADKRYYNAGIPRNYFISLNLGYTF